MDTSATGHHEYTLPMQRKDTRNRTPEMIIVYFLPIVLRRRRVIEQPIKAPIGRVASIHEIVSSDKGSPSPWVIR